MNHGSQYLSDHCQNQLKHWNIAPSFAFVALSQTNGLDEHFIRTCKKCGKLSGALWNNREWRGAKNGFLSLWQAKAQ